MSYQIVNNVNVLKCDGLSACGAKVTHIDEKGFVYCQSCGLRRKQSQIRCRKLKSSELKSLENGKSLERYLVKS